MRKMFLPLTFAAAFVVTAFTASVTEARETVRFRRLQARHHRGEHQRAAALSRGRSRQGDSLPGRRRQGRQGMVRHGVHRRQASHPAWSPPPAVRRDNPRLPTSSPAARRRNPMGVAALTLTGGEYAIHGTNVPGSIGGFVSYGCIRMHNRGHHRPVWPRRRRHAGGGDAVSGLRGRAKPGLFLNSGPLSHQRRAAPRRSRLRIGTFHSHSVLPKGAGIARRSGGER